MKILIIRLSSLGDIVLTQPVTALIRSHYPQAEIHYLTKPSFVELVSAFGTCDQILSYEKSLSFHRYLRSEYYDVCLDLHAKFSTVLLSMICRSHHKIRYDKMHFKRKLMLGRTGFISYFKRFIKPIDSVLYLYTKALVKMGIDINDPPLPLLLPSNQLNDLQTQAETQVDLSNPDNLKKVLANDFSLNSDEYSTSRLIALFPGAAHQTKIYPAKYWIDLIMNSPPEFRFLLLGSQKEEYLARAIQSETGLRTLNRCGHYSLTELISVMNSCDLVLSGDTGPMHIAAALGLPQIAIFGSTHPKLGFRPLNKKAVVLCRDLPCQPCSLHGFDTCPLGHFKCMLEIDPKSVLQSMQSLLAGQL